MNLKAHGRRSACFARQKVIDTHLFRGSFILSTRKQYQFELALRYGARNTKLGEIILTRVETTAQSLAM